MGLGRTWAVALVGLNGVLVDVQADAGAGIPDARIVGTASSAMKEARHRVKVAVRNCGLRWPEAKVVVNLSPADVPKQGSMFDLAIAVAVLCAGQVITAAEAARTVHLGELGLDGRVQPVRGVLPAVHSAVRAGISRVMVASENAAEARLVGSAEVIAVDDLTDVARHYGVDDVKDRDSPARPALTAVKTPRQPPAPDLRDVLAQHQARHALEVAAAGGYHLLMQGPPGTGKTMLAARLPGLLPDLSDDDALEVTAIHSLSGTLAGDTLIRRPPYVAPHHSASAPSIIGGGSGIARPGAISRAHCGVLFLDEAPEFASRVLETLRQPLESGQVSLHRANAHTTYPARIQLVLAANPCPCGNASASPVRARLCTCTPQMRRRYSSRLSGPVLDRVDIQVSVESPSRADLATTNQPETTATVAQRVAQARSRTRHRLAHTPWTSYTQVPGSWIRERTAAAGRGLTAALDHARERGHITLRGYDRILRLSWTLADIAERDLTADDIAAAYTLRTRERHG